MKTVLTVDGLGDILRTLGRVSGLVEDTTLAARRFEELRRAYNSCRRARSPRTT